MNNLKNYFFEDCSSIESLTPYEIYEKGYNRAKIEYLEEQLAEAKQKVGQDYVNAQMKLYTPEGVSLVAFPSIPAWPLQPCRTYD